jgi:hypothetical protein
MKKKFWNVQIERLTDGTVKAAVVRSRWHSLLPKDTYNADAGREAWSIWVENEEEAQGAVLEALAMNRKQGVAA